jgi:hypothetical protein
VLSQRFDMTAMWKLWLTVSPLNITEFEVLKILRRCSQYIRDKSPRHTATQSMDVAVLKSDGAGVTSRHGLMLLGESCQTDRTIPDSA